MRAFRLALTSACLAAAAWPVYAAGTVEVTLVAPASYIDAGNDPADAEANRNTLAAYLRELGQRYLKPEEVLKIEILDLDIAGTLRPAPRVGSGQVRIARGGADWPRIKMRYTLLADGKTVQSGEETVADMNYLRRAPGYRGDDPLGHEKRMLADWFKARFVEHKPAAG